MIVRSDLTEGQKAVQSAHAAVNFVFEHPNRAGPWFRESNYLVLLEADNEVVERIIDKCNKVGLDYIVFREPDLGNIITAIAIEPSSTTQKLVRNLKLLFQNKGNEST